MNYSSKRRYVEFINQTWRNLQFHVQSCPITWFRINYKTYKHEIRTIKEFSFIIANFFEISSSFQESITSFSIDIVPRPVDLSWNRVIVEEISIDLLLLSSRMKIINKSTIGRVLRSLLGLKLFGWDSKIARFIFLDFLKEKKLTSHNREKFDSIEDIDQIRFYLHTLLVRIKFDWIKLTYFSILFDWMELLILRWIFCLSWYYLRVFDYIVS